MGGFLLATGFRASTVTQIGFTATRDYFYARSGELTIEGCVSIHALSSRGLALSGLWPSEVDVAGWYRVILVTIFWLQKRLLKVGRSFNIILSSSSRDGHTKENLSIREKQVLKCDLKFHKFVLPT